MLDALDFSEFARQVSARSTAQLIVISATNGGGSLRWGEAFPQLHEPGRLEDGPLVLTLENSREARVTFDQLRRDLTGGGHSLISATVELFAGGERLGGFDSIEGRYEALSEAA